MRSVNQVILIGNLTRDAVVRETPQTVKYTTWGMATNRTVVTKVGETKQLAEFHECASFKPWIVKLAEKGALKKGKYIYAQGRLKTRSWDDESGKRFYRTEVIVDEDLIMLHPNPRPGEPAEHHEEHAKKETTTTVAAPAETEVEVEAAAPADPSDEDLF